MTQHDSDSEESAKEQDSIERRSNVNARWKAHRIPRLGHRLLGQSLDTSEVIALVAVVVPLVIGAAVAVHRGWIPISDEALIELRVRDIPSHLPLVGVYSRFGWNHPGPSQFYWLWIFYVLGRSASSALLVGSLTLHLTFTLVAWRAVRSIDRNLGLIVLIGSGLILATTSPPFLRTPWNPYVVLIGGLALTALGWSLAERRRAGSLLLLPSASLVIQSHLVNAPMALLIVATSVLLMLISFADSSKVRKAIPWRWLGAGVGTAALMWLPPIVQQVAGSPGNLAAIVTTGGDGRATGFIGATGVVTQAFSIFPSVLNPSQMRTVLVSTDLAIPIWLLSPLVGAILALRRRDRTYLRGLAINGVALIGVWVSIAVTTGGLFNYLNLAIRPIAVVTICLGLGSILKSLPSIPTGSTRRVLAAAACVIGVSIGFQQIRAENPLAGYAPTVRNLEHALVQAVPPGSKIEISSAADFHSAEVAGALMLQLERRGVTVTSVDQGASRVGAHRTGPGQIEARVAPLQLREALVDDGWDPLIAFEPLSPSERHKVTALREQQASIQEKLQQQSQGLTTAQAWVELTSLNDQINSIERDRVAALLVVRDTQPD